MSAEAANIADKLGAAVAARDASMLDALYDEDIFIWHGSTGQKMSRADNIAMLSRIFEMTSRMEYRDVRRYSIENGVVQQHQLVGVFDDGAPLPVLEVCFILKVANGKIVSVEEYFDGGTFAPVWERLGSLK